MPSAARSDPAPPCPQTGGVFSGGGEGWGWVWGLGLRAFLSPVFGECAVWVLRDIMFLTRKTIPQRRGSGPEGAKKLPERGVSVPLAKGKPQAPEMTKGAAEPPLRT